MKRLVLRRREEVLRGGQPLAFFVGLRRASTAASCSAPFGPGTFSRPTSTLVTRFSNFERRNFCRLAFASWRLTPVVVGAVSNARASACLSAHQRVVDGS